MQSQAAASRDTNELKYRMKGVISGAAPNAITCRKEKTVELAECAEAKVFIDADGIATSYPQ